MSEFDGSLINALQPHRSLDSRLSKSNRPPARTMYILELGGDKRCKNIQQLGFASGHPPDY
jgi:hypothetical protein